VRGREKPPKRDGARRRQCTTSVAHDAAYTHVFCSQRSDRAIWWLQVRIAMSFVFVRTGHSPSIDFTAPCCTQRCVANGSGHAIGSTCPCQSHENTLKRREPI
jgi:hypothetical protein